MNVKDVIDAFKNQEHVAPLSIDQGLELIHILKVTDTTEMFLQAALDAGFTGLQIGLFMGGNHHLFGSILVETSDERQ